MDLIWYGIPNKNIGVSEEKYGVFNENLKVSNESWGVESLMKILGISNVNLEGLQWKSECLERKSGIWM